MPEPLRREWMFFILNLPFDDAYAPLVWNRIADLPCQGRFLLTIIVYHTIMELYRFRNAF